MLMNLLLTLPMTNWLYEKCAGIRGLEIKARPLPDLGGAEEKIEAEDIEES